MTLSLPFDLALLSFPFPELPWDWLVIALSALTAILMARFELFTALRAIEARHLSFEDSISKHSGWGIALLGIIAAVELLVRLSGLGATLGHVAALGVVIVLARSIKSVRDSVRQRRADRARLKDDRIFWVERGNLQLFIVALMPIATARLLATAGAGLAALSPDPLLTLAPVMLLAVLALMLSYPDRELFMGCCPRCGFRTSRLLMELGYCLACNHQEFVEKSGEGLAAPQSAIRPTSASARAPARTVSARTVLDWILLALRMLARRGK